MTFSAFYSANIVADIQIHFQLENTGKKKEIEETVENFIFQFGNSMAAHAKLKAPFEL